MPHERPEKPEPDFERRAVAVKEHLDIAHLEREIAERFAIQAQRAKEVRDAADSEGKTDVARMAADSMRVSNEAYDRHAAAASFHETRAQEFRDHGGPF
jgi:hypothetical protein